MKKILCIQLKQIGDVLMNTPAVRALAQNNPDAEIHFLTQRPSHLIFEKSPYIKKVVIFPKTLSVKTAFSFIHELRNEKYDTVIDFMGSPKTALIGWLTGAPQRIGFDFRGRRRFYSHPVASPAHLAYSAQKKAYLLKELGITKIDNQLDFFIPESDQTYANQLFQKLGVDPKRPVISISPVSRQPYKVWPAENFAAICDRLVAEYQAQILFLWGPGEYHFIKAVRAAMKHSSLADYDIPSIGETVGILQKVDLHLGNDNGPMHFAIAAKIPTVAIFGRPQMKNWTPPQSSQHLAVEYNPGCKEKCSYPDCQLECLHGVTVENVWATISQLLPGKVR